MRQPYQSCASINMMQLNQHRAIRVQHAGKAGFTLEDFQPLPRYPASLSLRSPTHKSSGSIDSHGVVVTSTSFGRISDLHGKRTSCKASSSSSGAGHAGHAFLHDFCMAIPYGAIAMLAAVVLVALGAKQTATPLAIGGFVVATAAGLSLKNWRAEQQSTPFTLISAGTSGYLAYTCWTSVQAGIVPWLTGTVGVLSGALAIFAVYNILAGGNPPPKRK